MSSPPGRRVIWDLNSAAACAVTLGAFSSAACSNGARTRRFPVQKPASNRSFSLSILRSPSSLTVALARRDQGGNRTLALCHNLPPRTHTTPLIPVHATQMCWKLKRGDDVSCPMRTGKEET